MEGNFTTSGEVWIRLTCREAAQNITLNINDIKVHEETVKVTQLLPKGSRNIRVCTFGRRLQQQVHESSVVWVIGMKWWDM
jgi:hypothetical protein